MTRPSAGLIRRQRPAFAPTDLAPRALDHLTHVGTSSKPHSPGACSRSQCRAHAHTSYAARPGEAAWVGGPRKCGTRWVSSISRDEGAGRSAASASQTTGFRVRILATHQGVNVGGVVPPVAAWGDESGVEHAGGGPPSQCLAMDAKARSSFAARDKHDCGHTAMKLHACDWCQARLDITRADLVRDAGVPAHRRPAGGSGTPGPRQARDHAAGGGLHSVGVGGLVADE